MAIYSELSHLTWWFSIATLVYQRVIYIYICIYSGYILRYSMWHSFWHILWHSFGHCIWHLFWYSIWHLFRHSIWHSILAFEIWRTRFSSGSAREGQAWGESNSDKIYIVYRPSPGRWGTRGALEMTWYKRRKTWIRTTTYDLHWIAWREACEGTIGI